MKILATVLISAFFFSSCQNGTNSAISEEELLQQELKKIDWKQVDEFPSAEACDSIADAAGRKQCFFDFLAVAVQQKLDEAPLSAFYPESDTIQLRVTVYPDSKLDFEPLFPESGAPGGRQKIDSILRSRLADFPKINPALKRGIPVKSQFILPIILNVEKTKP
ncbi:MAG TPA: hypothetical protein VFR70_01420 [Flavobacterium sp.]|nr:hypothetical protein [Flavobacterium sp.]